MPSGTASGSLDVLETVRDTASGTINAVPNFMKFECDFAKFRQA